MSFIGDVATYIGDNTSLILNTNLFVGGFIRSSPVESVAVLGIGGGSESESGIVSQAVHIQSRSYSYIASRTLAFLILDLFKSGNGFSLGQRVYSSEIVNMPYPSGRDENNYLFSMDMLVNHISGWA